MTFDQFKLLIQRTEAQDPTLLSSPFAEPPATEVKISEIQTLLGAQLPASFVHFLKIYGGGMFGYADILSLITSEVDYIITSQPTDAKTLQFVAFSPNGSGDYYGFPIVGGSCEDRILFWDHEQNELDPTRYVDFFDFMAKVALLIE